MHNYKINTKIPKAQAKKTDFNLMIVHFIFVENWILYDVIQFFRMDEKRFKSI